MPNETQTEKQYPEHEKLSVCLGHSQAQGEFIEWLESQGLFLGEYVVDDGSYFMRTNRRITDLLAEFHGINQQALETEKRAMLYDLQQAHLNRQVEQSQKCLSFLIPATIPSRQKS